MESGRPWWGDQSYTGHMRHARKTGNVGWPPRLVVLQEDDWNCQHVNVPVFRSFPDSVEVLLFVHAAEDNFLFW